MWAIRNDAGEWWSNVTGWGGKEGRDVFSSADRRTLRLPLGGKWIAI
jgi:hypothetical protein